MIKKPLKTLNPIPFFHHSGPFFHGTKVMKVTIAKPIKFDSRIKNSCQKSVDSVRPVSLWATNKNILTIKGTHYELNMLATSEIAIIVSVLGSWFISVTVSILILCLAHILIAINNVFDMSVPKNTNHWTSSHMNTPDSSMLYHYIGLGNL